MSDTNTGLISKAKEAHATATQHWHETMNVAAQTLKALRLLENDPDEMSGPEFSERQA